MSENSLLGASPSEEEELPRRLGRALGRRQAADFDARVARPAVDVANVHAGEGVRQVTGPRPGQHDRLEVVIVVVHEVAAAALAAQPPRAQGQYLGPRTTRAC